MSFESITAYAATIGNSVGSNFFRNYGEYIGKNGKAMEFVSQYVPAISIIGLFFIFLAVRAAFVYHRTRDATKIYPHLGLMIAAGCFVFDNPYSQFFLYGAMLVISVLIMFQLKNPSGFHFWASICVLVALSFVLFGTLETLPVVGGVGAGIAGLVYMAQNRVKRGSKAGRREESKEGYDVRGELKSEKMLERAESFAEHAEGGAATAAEVKAEMANVSAEIQEGVVAASIKDVSAKLAEANNTELSIEQRELKTVDYLRTQAEAMKKHSVAVSDDEAATEANLKADAKRTVMTVGAIVQNEEYLQKFMHSSLKAIDDITKTAAEAAQFADSVLHFQLKDEKFVKSQWVRDVNKIGMQLHEKGRKLKKIEQSQGYADNAELQNQARVIKDEKERIAHSIQQLNTIREQVISVTKKGRQAIQAVIGDAKQLVTLEEKAKEFAHNAEKLEAVVGENVSEMKDAFQQFRRDIADLDKNALPEEVIIKATKHISIIFDAFLKLISASLDLNKKDILPFIQEDAGALKETWKIEKALEYANRVSVYVSDALSNISRTEEMIGNPKQVHDAKKLEEIDAMEKQISAFAFHKEKKVLYDIKGSFAVLSSAITAITNQIRFLEQEMQGISADKTKELDALSSAMRTLADIRKKQFARLNQAASKAEADLGAARHLEQKEKRAA